MPFFDVAYQVKCSHFIISFFSAWKQISYWLANISLQGFASGSLDEDASSVRLFVQRGLEVFVAQSYSKNLGLYAERIGAINVVCSTPEVANRWYFNLNDCLRSQIVHFYPVIAANVNNRLFCLVGNMDQPLIDVQSNLIFHGRLTRLLSKFHPGKKCCKFLEISVMYRLIDTSFYSRKETTSNNNWSQPKQAKHWIWC